MMVTKGIKFQAAKARNRFTAFEIPVRQVTSRYCHIPTRVAVTDSSSNSPLRELCNLLADVFHVELLRSAPIPDKVDKKFCEGLLEPGPHPWKRLLSRYGQRTRMTVSHSLFLFRKTLFKPPPDLAECETNFAKKMSQPSKRVSRDFLDFCRRETGKIFKQGWDQARIDDKIRSFTLPTSACQENSRKHGGARGLKFRSGEIERGDVFNDMIQGNFSVSRLSKVCAVHAGGKLRVVTIAPWKRMYLKPLHEAMYDRISKESWLLRGEADPCVFEGFRRKEGEVFVSGDYESATDNISGHVSRAILSVVVENSWMIPDAMKRLAMETLDSVLYVDRGTDLGWDFYPTDRQLMGNPLCFPLLCLVNYFTFKYSVPRDVPVKINGDDIVFRSTPEEKERWMNGVKESGLILSLGKTMLSRSMFSLNSSIFRASDTSVRRIPFIRSSCLFGTVDCPTSIGGRVDRVSPGVTGVGKRVIQAHVLARQHVQVSRSNRGLEDLGVFVKWHVVKMAGMERREVFYRSLQYSQPIPLPKSKWMQSCIPKGWKRKFSAEKQDQAFIDAMIHCAWNNEPRIASKQSDDQYWREINRSGVSFAEYCNGLNQRLRKSARMLRCSVRTLRKKIPCVRPIRYGERPPGKEIWVREEEPVEEVMSAVDIELDHDAEDYELEPMYLGYRSAYSGAVSSYALPP